MLAANNTNLPLLAGRFSRIRKNVAVGVLLNKILKITSSRHKCTGHVRDSSGTESAMGGEGTANSPNKCLLLYKDDSSKKDVWLLDIRYKTKAS